MKKIKLSERFFRGAVSLEITEAYVKPLRIPFKDAHLFVPERINGKAEIPAGVRLSLYSDTNSIVLDIIPAEADMKVDCIVDGKFLKTGLIKAGERRVIFNFISQKTQLIELYLSQKVPVKVSSIWVDDDATCSDHAAETGLRWITYGSSITQCVEAESPSQTWPAIVARQMNFDLTCLGFDGNCHLEPMVARMIRDLPADFISLCIGINILGHNSLSERSFIPGVIGFIETIRDKHPKTPILIISPIYHAKGEEVENKVGLSLRKMREELATTVRMLRKYDSNLYYMDGLDLFGKTYEAFLHDGLHPSAEGYEIMAEQFQALLKMKIPGF